MGFLSSRTNRKLCLTAVLSIVVSGGMWLEAQQSGSQPPDFVLHNGKILTVDANFSTAQAAAIAGNRFTAVGSDSDIRRLAGPGTTVIDLKGRTVIPGLIDTHTHLHEYAFVAYGGDLKPEQVRRYPVDWRGVASKEDVLNQVRGIMSRYNFRPGEWVYLENQLSFVSGGEVNQAKILYDELNRDELSKVTPDNPVVMSLGIPDFNGFLVNDRGMEILMREYGDYIRKYGRYWVDSQGRPDGHMEPPASRLPFLYLPEPDPEEVAGVYEKYLQEWSAAGVTSISTRLPKFTVESYKLLQSRGRLPLRVGYGQEWFFGTIPDPASGMSNLKGLVGTGDDWLWTTSVAPTEVDGATTRACTDQPRGRAFGTIDSWWPTGQCQTDAEFKGAAGKSAQISGHYFRDWVMTSGAEGIRFANTHVAGDRSVHNLLGWAQEIQRRHGTAATRGWMLDHCFLVNPEDIPLAARLGIGFSCAPKYLDRASEVAQSYGAQVANTYMVPVKTMLDGGAKVYFESDRDTYVWQDLEILLTRKDRRGNVWGPQEAVDRATALRMITRWAADYVLKPEQLGSIEAGKLADLAVLDRDYMTIPSEQVSEIQAQLTMLDGKIVYLHPEFSRETSLRPQGAVISTHRDLVNRRTSDRRPDF